MNVPAERFTFLWGVGSEMFFNILEIIIEEY